MAIAARMPMIKITTNSSMSVNPRSSRRGLLMLFMGFSIDIAAHILELSRKTFPALEDAFRGPQTNDERRPMAASRVHLRSSEPLGSTRSGYYQLPAWQPPPVAPVAAVGVQERSTVPFAFLVIVNVCPPIAVAVTL